MHNTPHHAGRRSRHSRVSRKRSAKFDARLMTNRVLIESASLRTENGSPPPANEAGLVKR
jgi:hypothetical protein